MGSDGDEEAKTKKRKSKSKSKSKSGKTTGEETTDVTKKEGSFETIANSSTTAPSVSPKVTGNLSRFKKPLLILLLGVVTSVSFIIAGATHKYYYTTTDDDNDDNEPAVIRNVEFVEDLQFLSLGATIAITSSEDEESTTEEATSFSWYASYPYLLSPDHKKVTHLADGVIGPRYPSVCIQSMVSEAIEKKVADLAAEHLYATEHLEGIIDDPAVQEEINDFALTSEEFDVIVLNYYTKARDGLYELAQRLRTRYPDAILVLLRLWKPVHIGWYKNNERAGSLRDWSNFHHVEFDSVEFFEEIQKYPTLDFRWQQDAPRGEVMDKIVKDFNAHVYVLPYTEDSPKTSIIESRHWFNKDFTRLSAEGHRVVAIGILNIVFEQFHEYYPKQPRVGDWGDGDLCQSWFMTGVCKLPHSPNLIMEQFEGQFHTEYALSTSVNNPTGAGWIVMSNPFDDMRNFILSYMVKGPSPSIYPKTLVRVIKLKDGDDADSEIREIVKMEINPVTNEYDSEVHTVATTKVATLPPGHYKIVWKPLQDTGRPFRLTAAEVVGRGVQMGGILGPAADFSHFGLY